MRTVVRLAYSTSILGHPGLTPWTGSSAQLLVQYSALCVAFVVGSAVPWRSPTP